jgi:hypothetical protein
MADRPNTPFKPSLVPSRTEVESAKLREERDEVNPVITTPADELDHEGLELEDEQMGDFRTRREEPWVSWPSM